jgi:alkyl hydroperoxide reductase subunit AhpC
MKPLLSFKIPLFALLFLFAATTAAQAVQKIPRKAPPFPEKAIWLNLKANTPPPAFKGKVTLVEFWDYASIHSVRDVTVLKKWLKAYGDLGFQVISVHSPDFGFAYKKENLKRAVERLEIRYPVLLDNDFKMWKAYEVFSWPTQFLVDPKGKIVFSQIGEGNARGVEEKIRELLTRRDRKMKLPSMVIPQDRSVLFDEVFCGDMSDEIRIGYGESFGLRSASIANVEGFQPEKVVEYQDLGNHNYRSFFAHGAWRNFADSFEHARATAGYTDYVGILFEGYEVYAALSASRLDPAKVYLLLDSQPVPFDQRGKDVTKDPEGSTYVLVSEPRLYYLLSHVSAGPHELKLYTKDEGVSVHNFSFGNQCLAEFDHL